MVKPSPVSRRVQHHAQHQSAFDFFNALTHPELLDCVEARLPVHRERLFPPTETLSMFVAQVLSADGSCQHAVDQAATTRLLHGLPLCSTATGGYCQARARLPLTLLTQLTEFVGGCIEDQTPQAWLWHGRRVRIVDGTTLTMPDTAANQAAYPQQRNQKPGLGFPICRLVGAFNLADGALVDPPPAVTVARAATNKPCYVNCWIVSMPAMWSWVMRCLAPISCLPSLRHAASTRCLSSTVRADDRLTFDAVSAWVPEIT